MKLYIAGPMTGFLDKNFPTFLEATEDLKYFGYEVSSPFEVEGADTDTYEDRLKRALVMMMACEGVAFLPSWQRSKGAKLEHDVAMALKMPWQPVSYWIRQAMTRPDWTGQ